MPERDLYKSKFLFRWDKKKRVVLFRMERNYIPQRQDIGVKSKLGIEGLIDRDEGKKELLRQI